MPTRSESGRPGSGSATPLLTHRLRRWLGPALTVVLAWTLAVGLTVRHSRRTVLFDRWFDTLVASPSGPRHAWATRVSDVGDPRYFVPLVAVLALLLLLAGEIVGALTAVVGAAVAVLLVEFLLKPFFDRRLPGLPALSFPSGHAITAFTVAGALVLACGSGRPLARRVGAFGRHLIAIAALLVAVSIGLAMVALQAHFATDVVTGAFLGLVIAGCTARCVDLTAGLVGRTVAWPPRLARHQ